MLTSNTLAAPGTLTPTLASHNVINLIKALTPLKNYLDLFKAVRFDIHVNIVIRAAASMYGAWGACFQYGTPDTDIVSLMTSDFYIASIASSEAIDFVIPFRYTHNYLQVAAGYDEEYATVHVLNMFSASIDGGSTALDYDIFVSLENADGAMPVESVLVNPQSKMGTGLPPINAQTFENAMMGAALLHGMAHSSATHSSYENYNLHTTEDSKKPWDYKNSKEIDTHGGGKSHGVRQSFFGDLSTLTGQVNLPSLGEEEKPEQVYVPDNQLMGSDMSIDQIGKYPGPIMAGTFTNLTVRGSLKSVTLSLGGTRNSALGRFPASLASYYSRYARYYRGDHKLVFHFFTSPLVAARVRISVGYVSRTLNSYGFLSSPDSFEVPSETILVKGDTRVSITVPFLSANSVIPVQTPYASMLLELLEPPSTVSATGTTVYYVVTHSVDDFELYSLQHGMSTQADPAVLKVNNLVTPQSSLRRLHHMASDITFGQPGPKVHVAMPRINTVLDIMRRFDTSTSAIVSIDTLNIPTSRINHNLECNLVTASTPFAFVSGSVENRLYYDTATRDIKIARLDNFIDNSNDYAANGIAVTMTPEWPILDFRTPFRASVPMVQRRLPILNQFYEPNMADVTLSDANPTLIYVRAGPDFALHYLNFILGSNWLRFDFTA